MERKKIKGTDLEISPVNFGGNVFGWTLEEAESFKILDAFTGAGFNFIDTADTYPWWKNGVGGLSETIIGKWMKQNGNRDKLVIATKVGSENKEHPKDISRRHILKSVDESLQRLQTDYIDLYYTHFDDEETPVEETLAAYDEAIKAGKVRHIAASNVKPDRLKASFEAAEKNNLPKYVALQPLYNLVERKGYENDYLPFAEKYNLSVFPYASLAKGFLTGKYRSQDDLGKSVRGNSVAGYMDNKGTAILKALDEVSAKHNTDQATVSIAWLLAQPHIDAAIVSATSEKQLKSLINAPELNLDAGDLQQLDYASK